MRACPDKGNCVSLRKLFPNAKIVGADDIYVASCTCDSRKVESGDLFAALPGNMRDGLDFVGDAITRGCTAILSQKPLEDTIDVPYCIVDDARNAYGRICQATHGYPSSRLKVIGITGTNGKTTTSLLVTRILARAGHKVGLVGTLGYYDGRRVEDASLTTPSAEKLASLFDRMVENGCTHAVLEVSSHALDQARVAGIEMDVVCVTNVRRDHLDYHPTIQDYQFSKSKLLDYLSAEGITILNADDLTSAAYLHQINGPVLTVSMNATSEISATMLEQQLSEQMFLLSAGSESVPVRTKMIGEHHVYNCLIAAAVGLAYGTDLETIVQGLESVEYVLGRLQRLECGQPFGAFVDYAHTPDALTVVLQTLRNVADGRLICVFGAGGDRDKQKRSLMGHAVEKLADLAVVTSDNPRSEDPQSIAEEIVVGFQQPECAKVILNRADAIQWALAEAKPGDCVLIAGRGHEKTQTVGEKQMRFDDYEIASRLLYENQPRKVSVVDEN